MKIKDKLIKALGGVDLAEADYWYSQYERVSGELDKKTIELPELRSDYQELLAKNSQLGELLTISQLEAAELRQVVAKVRQAVNN